jgi:hypothetical protein
MSVSDQARVKFLGQGMDLDHLKHLTRGVVEFGLDEAVDSQSTGPSGHTTDEQRRSIDPRLLFVLDSFHLKTSSLSNGDHERSAFHQVWSNFSKKRSSSLRSTPAACR